ncbi:MAG: aminoacyl-tRNA hydrolase [Candidatus Latescibacteria bacterium]|nr:aminoacyl-tRNA hydrolase [Candidatus Latescibacterota bacterium]
MRIVVGLGNPGARYELTRHNIGFLVVEQLAEGTVWRSSAKALTARVSVGDPQHEVLLVKPQTFMNGSGEVFEPLRDQMDVEPEHVLVILDDFLLDVGRMRLRRGGTDGGHNGLASVLQHLATDQVPRLRLGVGPVPEDVEDIDYVLTRFAPSDDVDELVHLGCAATRCWVAEDVEAAMNRFNGFPPLSPGEGHTP